MELAGIGAAVIFGIVFGSFLNVCVDRLPANESLTSPPSHCPSCRRRLSFLDLIPVISFIWLKGRCRYCGSAIPARVFAVEVITGMLFGYLYWRYGWSLHLALAALYCSLFVVIAFIDLEHSLILNKIVFPAAAVVLAIGLFVPPASLVYANAPAPAAVTQTLAHNSVLQAITGGLTGFAIFFAIALASRGGMGWGDVKMAGLIGLVTGYPLVFEALFISVFTGGLVAVALLLFKQKGRKDAIPFGPFMSFGVIATLLWGGGLLDWYMQLLHI